MNLFFLHICLTNVINVQIRVICVYKQALAKGSKRGCVLEGTAYLSSSIMYICTCQVSFALYKTVNSCLFLVLDDKSSRNGILDISYVMIYLIFKGAKNQTLTQKSFSRDRQVCKITIFEIFRPIIFFTNLNHKTS